MYFVRRMKINNYCTNCGNTVKRENNFCEKCGRKIGSVENNLKHENQLDKKFKLSITFTVISFAILAIDIYKIVTFTSHPLFGDLGAMGYYIILFPSIIFFFFSLAILIDTLISKK